MRTPLTEAEHARLRDLLAQGALPRLPVDEHLIELGLAMKYNVALTVARWQQVAPWGIEPYYEADGEVNPVSYPTIGQPDVLAPRSVR